MSRNCKYLHLLIRSQNTCVSTLHTHKLCCVTTQLFWFWHDLAARPIGSSRLLIITWCAMSRLSFRSLERSGPITPGVNVSTRGPMERRPPPKREIVGSIPTVCVQINLFVLGEWSSLFLGNCCWSFFVILLLFSLRFSTSNFTLLTNFTLLRLDSFSSEVVGFFFCQEDYCGKQHGRSSSCSFGILFEGWRAAATMPCCWL